ncbi:MAG: hypothetical protein COB02_12355 [Candidatus Cloacimonadota bacterium]|nr:MAG: hypothetical protein COB02_12355 [Candidatus Cloacimonadota bacterium]
MNCECVENINKIAEKDNYMIKLTMTRISDTKIVARIMIPCITIEKKRGFRAPNFHISYCPFCGKKVDD